MTLMNKLCGQNLSYQKYFYEFITFPFSMSGY